MSSQRSTDLSDARQQPRRRNAALQGEAKLAERRVRAAITERRLPDATEGRHALPVSKSPSLLTEDQRRQRASYSIPAAEVKQRAVDKLRSEIDTEINEVARRLRLNLLATRTLQIVRNAQKAADDVYVTLTPASIADILNAAPGQGPNKISADQVRVLVEALTKLGALGQQASWFPGVQPRYRVNI